VPLPLPSPAAAEATSPCLAVVVDEANSHNSKSPIPAINSKTKTINRTLVAEAEVGVVVAAEATTKPTSNHRGRASILVRRASSPVCRVVAADKSAVRRMRVRALLIGVGRDIVVDVVVRLRSKCEVV
jgi:hypothetical protein